MTQNLLKIQTKSPLTETKKQIKAKKEQQVDKIVTNVIK